MSIRHLLELLFQTALERPKRRRSPEISESPWSIRIGAEVLRRPDEPERPAFLFEQDLKRSVYIIGATGGGKTTVITVLILALIEAGRTVVIIDPTGDLVDIILTFLADWERKRGDVAKRLTLFDIRQSVWITSLNPLDGVGDPIARALAVLATLQEMADSWGVRLNESLQHALILISLAKGALTDLEAVFYDRQTRASMLKHCTNEPTRSYWARYDALPLASQEMLAAPCLNKAAFLAIPLLRWTLGNATPLPLGDLINRKGEIVLIALNTEFGSISNLLGGLIVTSLERLVLARASTPEANRNPVSIVADEFSLLTQDRFTGLLFQGRRLYANCFLAHQSAVQLGSDLKTSIRSCCPTALYLQVGATDAMELSREVVTRRPRNDFKEDLMRMPVGEGFVARRSAEPVRVRFDRLEPPDVPAKEVEALRQQALKRFGVSRRTLERRTASSGVGSSTKNKRRVIDEIKPIEI